MARHNRRARDYAIRRWRSVPSSGTEGTGAAGLAFSFEHGLFRKPVSTFRDHALKPEIELLDQIVVVEFVSRAAFEGDLAVNDDIAAVGNADRLGEVLLRHQHGERITLFHLVDGIDGPADQDRRQPD